MHSKTTSRAHNLNVESERSTSRSGRICRCCHMVVDGRRVIEDEMLFILECLLHAEDRKICFEKIPELKKSPDFYPNEKKLQMF